MTDPAILLADVHARIAQAAKIAQRKAGEVTLIAVSKTHDAAAIEPLIAAGQRVFGENRVQEAAAKWPALRAAQPGIELHLIGQLQSNKAEEAVALFDAIHSVDRSSLVQAIAKACERAGKQPQLFVQVNVGDEEQKGAARLPTFPRCWRKPWRQVLRSTASWQSPPRTSNPHPSCSAR